MRIIQLTAGTGSFYCGTCMRDNALVVELRRQGHEALLVPMYLEPVLDEATAAEGVPLFYGGINVYLQQKLSLFRRTPRWLDRLLDAPGLLRAAAGRAGMTSARELGEITLSMLRGEEGWQLKELDRLVAWMQAERPEVVCLSNALLIGLARRVRERLRVPVVCFLNGEDSFLDSLPEPERRQCWETLAARAADVAAFLPVSRYYGDLIRERLRLPADRVRVVHPGILLEGYAPAAAPSEPPVLGYLARMHPTKGLETLIEAFVILRAGGRLPGLKLRIAGSCTAGDEAYVARLRERLAVKGLAADAEFLPNVDRNEKIAFLRSLSVLSVPATYGEAYGLYVLEALAAGVPVVQPRHGAFPEILEATGGGLLCEPDDPVALATAVEELLRDRAAARALGERGRQSVMERFGVERMARETLAVLEGVTDHTRAR
jgi:glycosyltransferase involved in cell wall biosynthesis